MKKKKKISKEQEIGIGLNNDERSVYVANKIHYPIRTAEMDVGPDVVCARVGSSDPQLVCGIARHVPPCRVGCGPALRCVVPSSSPTCGLPSLLTPRCGSHAPVCPWKSPLPDKSDISSPTTYTPQSPPTRYPYLMTLLYQHPSLFPYTRFFSLRVGGWLQLSTCLE